MPFDLLLVNPSQRVSPTRLRKEVEALTAKIKEEEDELKMLKNDYNELKADRGNPKFADGALVQTLTWITQTKSTIQENEKLLSDAKASLERVEKEAELRNNGMLVMSSISSRIVFVSYTHGVRRIGAGRSRQCLCPGYGQVSTYEKLA
jgi:predicted RNase H-like nuclease (RuvC/YqgF family)